MKPHFNTLALDQLLADSVANVQSIQQQIQTDSFATSNAITPSLQPQYGLVPDGSPVSPEINNMVEQSTDGKTVDYTRVYSQLQRLIQQGNIALQVLGSIDPDVSGVEVASATASLMNAIKGCVAEFTKVHGQHIKHQQTIELLQIKHQMKMQQLKLKTELYNKKNGIEETSEPVQLVPWQTESMLGYLNYIKQNKKESE